MRTMIKPIFQIQRINDLENKMEKWKNVSTELVAKRPNAKAWSGLEVMKHIVQAQDAYNEKMATAFACKTNVQPEMSEYKAAAIPSFLIKRFAPKDGVIRFKMKTAKQFKPVLEVDKISDSEVQSIISELEMSLATLKNWVESYRTEATSMKKMNSAIGPIVRFTIPEACEFILCHNERHFLQLERTLEVVQLKNQ